MKLVKQHSYTVTEVQAVSFDCSHPDCEGESLTITRSGIISWKSPHNKQVHANAITVNQLLKIYIGFANKGTLKDLQKMLGERIEKAA